MSRPTFTADKALIFRITHIQNLAWIMDNGLHCQSSLVSDPDFTPIGRTSLIEQRTDLPIRHKSGGNLSDYIPFYFVPKTPMLYNIVTGRGVRLRTPEEIVVIISSIHKALGFGAEVIFTDRAAYMETANFHHELAKLASLPWVAFNRFDFKRQVDDLDAFDRYRAEALVKRHLPIQGILAIGVFRQYAEPQVNKIVRERSAAVNVVCRPHWCPQ